MRVTIRTCQWLLGVLFGLRRGPQVLRDSRTKESSSGVQMTVAEKQSWRHQIREFLKEHREETPRQKVARLRKVQWAQPRLATLDWLRAIEHQLRWSCGKTLASFHNAAHLEAAVVHPGVVTFPPDAGIKPGASAPVLVVCSDMHSVQTAAAAFLPLLRTHPGPASLLMERSHGVYHESRLRRHRPGDVVHLQHPLRPLAAIRLLSPPPDRRSGYEHIALAR